MKNDNDTQKPAPAATSDQQNESREPVRDLPHLIKWILLILLLLLLIAELAAGEFGKLSVSGWPWLILIIKLILIIGIIILMRVQKSVKCEILTPTGCTPEQPDTTQGILTIDVTGTASGGAFNYYTLEIQKNSDPVIPGIISYPGGGANGSAPVSNGLLGTFNTTLLSDGGYIITLRVYPIGGGAPCVKTTAFNLLKIAVWINNVAGSEPTTHILDEMAELGVGTNIHSFGGGLHINGSAYVYDCAGRRVESVEMRYAQITLPGSAPSQPATDSAVPATWPVTNQLHAPLVYSDLPLPSKYAPWTRIGINPNRLINDWGTCDVFGTIYSKLIKRAWQSRQATDGGGTMGGGKFSLLLITEDTAAHRYFDTQKIWLDNWPVVAKFVQFQIPGDTPGTWVDVPFCTDILISWKKLRIIGLAWDALIDPAFPATTDPNDNFGSYSLEYSKQFVPGWIPIPISSPGQRVPNNLAPVPGPLVADADADVLVEWDLTSLDAGTSPIAGECGVPAGSPHQLYRDCECTYTLKLAVGDSTITQTTVEHNKHNPRRFESIKVINDL